MSSGSQNNENLDPSQRPQPGRPRLATAAKVIAVIGILVLLLCLLLPAVRSSRPAAYRNACTNKLKQIAIALRTYEETYHALPPAYTTDAQGKPLHSWRTLILPFIEEKELYASIDLGKPWDHPANAHALARSVDAYQCPSAPDRDNRTSYLAVVTPASCLQAGKPRSLSDITDGLSTSLMVIEVDSKHAVPWMSPVDADENVVLELGPSSELNHTGGMGAAFADGHVSFLSEKTSADQRRALISIAGDDNDLLDVND